jgi:hypothetical protein
MTAPTKTLHDLSAALRAALREWNRCRWLRSHGNTDACPF